MRIITAEKMEVLDITSPGAILSIRDDDVITGGRTCRNLVINGSEISINSLSLIGGALVQAMYAGRSASNVSISDSLISTDSTSTTGIGVQVNQAACNNWNFNNVRVDSYSYGILVNTTAGGSNGMSIIGGMITADHGDAICINSPDTAIENVVVVGARTSVNNTVDINQGFGVSFAHVNGAAVVGNISDGSPRETDHIEDGSKNISIVGNIRKNCQGDGLRHLIGGVGAHQAETKPLSIIGNTYEAQSITIGSSGIRVVQDAAGTPYGNTIIGNVIRNFETGLSLGGGASHFADGNVIENCTYAMKVEEGKNIYTRVTGINTVINTPTLLYISSSTGAMVQAGKFICDAAPSNVILKATPGATRPGCSVAGFSWPVVSALSAGVSNYQTICPLSSTNRMSGKITVQVRDTAGIANNIWVACDLFWDGATLTIQNLIKEEHGTIALTGPAFAVSGGNLQLGVYAATAISARHDINFDGVYMA